MMFSFVVMLLLITIPPHQHQHQREKQKTLLTDALFCLTLEQKCAPEMTSIIESPPFNKIIDETRIISTVSDMMNNGTFGKNAIEEYIKSIVTDILVNVTRSNIDYFLDEYSREYIIYFMIALSIACLCICLCLINFVFYCKYKEKYDSRQLL